MDIFSIFFNMKKCCMVSLKSPRRGTQYTTFNIKQKNHPNPQLWEFFQGIQNEFETAMVNELSVF